MSYLYDALLEHHHSGAYPFHMPGHKREKEGFINPFLIDITEIEGFDNLHHAEGILKEAQQRAARLYGSRETHFLVNGSTCGILSAISACTRKGGKILMARNCHKAAYHAVFLNELDPVYLYPQGERSLRINGGINPVEVETLLGQNPDIQAVVITSPTYDGVVSDVERIAKAAHAYGIPLIVDEAHGAHFGMHSYFPENSIGLGADLVIHSLHKTLPSLTQTALLHINGGLVDGERVRRYLGIYQTSSPSYVFMAGIDECMRLIENHGSQLFDNFKDRLCRFYEEMAELENIKTVRPGIIGTSHIFDFDQSKLVLSVKDRNMDGIGLMETLRKSYRIELEMAAGSYALALSSIGDTDQGFARLSCALKEIDKTLKAEVKSVPDDRVDPSEAVYKLHEALERPKEAVFIEEAQGMISGEFLYLYPPGIPLLVPGERMNQAVIEKVKGYRKRGYSIQGLRDYEAKQIQVIKE